MVSTPYSFNCFKSQKLNTNVGKFMEKEKRKSIQKAIETLNVTNPFEETYSLDDFRIPLVCFVAIWWVQSSK